MKCLFSTVLICHSYTHKHAHTHTPTKNTWLLVLSTLSYLSAYPVISLPLNPLEKHYFDSPKCPDPYCTHYPTHRRTWGKNQFLWHFISLFAVAMETGLAEEDGLRVCVCSWYWCSLDHRAFCARWSPKSIITSPAASIQSVSADTEPRPKLIFTWGNFLTIICFLSKCH